MSKDMERPALEWAVCLRDDGGQLVRIAELSTEAQAALLAGSLLAAGISAIYFKPTVEW